MRRAFAVAPPRGPGRGSISSGQKLREAIEAFLHDQRLLYRPPRRARRRPSRRWPLGGGPAHVRATPVLQAGQQRQVAAQAAAARRLGRDLRGHPRPPRPRDAGHTIAAQLGISRPTVYAICGGPGPRVRAAPQRSGQVVRPYMTYLIQRWREGCTDSMQLWRETRALGYAHSARTVSRFITRLRQASAAGWARRPRRRPTPVPRGRRAGGLLHLGVPRSEAGAGRPTVYGPTDPRGSHARPGVYPEPGFLALVRERRGAALVAWMTEASASGIERRPALPRGSRKTLTAITAGLTCLE